MSRPSLFVLTVLALALAACQPAAGDDAAAPADAAPPPPAAAGSTPPVADDAPAPPPEALRYVGRWAAEANLCDDGAWVFSADGLQTAGETTCRFSNVRDIPGGYALDADCNAQGTPSSGEMRLTFAASARAMLVDAPALGWELGLTPCDAEGA